MRFAFMNQPIGRTSDAIACHGDEMTGLAHVPDAPRIGAATRGEGHGGLWPLTGYVAAQILYIAITLFIFANIQDRSETITAALIGLVFAGLRASTLASACAQRRAALRLENEIKSVRQAMAQEIRSPAISDAEIDRSLEALTKPFRLEYAGLAAIAAICLYQLGIAIIYGTAYRELLGLH
jgi:preprotein translocase subunit Sss1